MLNSDLLKGMKSPPKNKSVNAQTNTKSRSRTFLFRNNFKYGISQKTTNFNEALFVTRSRNDLENSSRQVVESVRRSSESYCLQQAVETVGSHGVVEVVNPCHRLQNGLLPKGLDIKSNSDVSVFVSSQYDNRPSVSNLAHQNKVMEKVNRTANTRVLHKSVSVGVGKWKQPAACSVLNKNKWKSKCTGVQQTDNDSPVFKSHASVYVVDTERMTPVKVGIKKPELRNKCVLLAPPCPEVISGCAEVVCVNSGVNGMHRSVLLEASARPSSSSNLLLEPHSKNNSFDNQIKNDVSKEKTMLFSNESSGDLNSQDADLNIDSKKHTVCLMPKNKVVSKKKTLMMANEGSMCIVDEGQDLTKSVSPKSCDNIVKSGTMKKKLTKKLPKKAMDKVYHRMSNQNNIEYKKCLKHEKNTLKLPHVSIMKKRRKTKKPSLAVVAAAIQQTKKEKHTADVNIISLKTTLKSPKKGKHVTKKNIALKTPLSSPKIANQLTEKGKHESKDTVIPLKAQKTSVKTAVQNIIPLEVQQTSVKTAIEQTKKGKQAIEGSIISLRIPQKSPKTSSIKSKKSLINSDQSDHSNLVSSFDDQSNGMHGKMEISNHIDNFQEKSRKSQVCKSKARMQTSKTASAFSDCSSSLPEDDIRRRHLRRLRKAEPTILTVSDSADQDNIVLTPTLPMDCSPAGSSPKLQCNVREIPNSKSSNHPLDATADAKISLESEPDIPYSKRTNHPVDATPDGRGCLETEHDIPYSKRTNHPVDATPDARGCLETEHDIPYSKRTNHPVDATPDGRGCLEFKLDIPNIDLVKSGLFWKEEYMNELNHDQFPLVTLSRLDDKTHLSLDESDNDFDIYSVSSGSSLSDVDFSMVDQDAVKDVDMNDCSTSFSGSEESEDIPNSDISSVHFKNNDIQSSVCKKLTSVSDHMSNKGCSTDTSGSKHSLEDMQVKCDTLSTSYAVTDTALGVFSCTEDGELCTSKACSPLVQKVTDQTIDDNSTLVTDVLEIQSKPETVSTSVQVIDQCFGSCATNGEFIVHNSVVGGDCVHAGDIGRDLRMSGTPLGECLHGDIDYSDELDGEYNLTMTSCERAIRKEVVLCNSFKDFSDVEKEYKNVAESLDENFNLRESASSSCQAATDSCIITPLYQSSHDQSVKTKTVTESSLHDGNSSDQVSEHNTSNCTAKLSHQNANLRLSDDQDDVTTTFVKHSSDIVTDRHLVLETSEKYLPSDTCNKEYPHNEITLLPGSIRDLNCQTLNYFSPESISKQILSSHQYAGIEHAHSEASDSDMSETCKKGLEDMLDNLRDVEAWTSPSNASQADSVTSRNMDLSDIVLDDIVIGEYGIDCNVTIPANELMGNCSSHQEDLCLLQEALDCLGPSMLGIENHRDFANNTSTTKPKNSVFLSPGSEDQEGICVEEDNVNILQNELQGGPKFEEKLFLGSQIIGKLPIPKAKVVLERFDLKNTNKVGDIYLDRIGGVGSHSWRVTYDVNSIPSVHKLGGIESHWKVSTDENTGSPIKPGLIREENFKFEHQVGSKEPVFQTGKDNQSANEKEKTHRERLIWNDKRKSDIDEKALSGKNGLHSNIDSKSEYFITSPSESHDDAIDITDFGKAITASKLKARKLKRIKGSRQNSAENESDKLQGSPKSLFKAVLPLDTLSKPKSKLVQKILREREEKAANKKSATSLPSLEIAPFKDIISSNFFKSSDSNVFGIPPKVTFGRSFRKTDKSRLSDNDSERLRSPLDLCVATNENIKFKTVKESHLSLFKSPKSSADRSSFVFGDTSITNDLSQGKQSFLDLSADVDSMTDSPESPQKDSTVKSELLSRLESVLNSSCSSIVSSPSSPKSSTPLITRRKQQIVMFSPIVRSTSVSSTDETDILIVAPTPATKSILKNSTSNILAELKSRSSTSLEMMQLNKQKHLKIQNSPCSGSVLSSDAFESRSQTSDDDLEREDFIQSTDSCDKDSTGTTREFDENSLDLTNTTECWASACEENVASQGSLNETDDADMLMTHQCGVQMDVYINASVREYNKLEVVSDSIGSKCNKEKIPFIVENTSLDKKGRNISSHMDGKHICSENVIKQGFSTNKMDDYYISTRDAPNLANSPNKIGVNCSNTESTSKLENEQNLKDGNHTGSGDTTKTDNSPNRKDASTNSGGHREQSYSVDDSSVCTSSSISTLLQTDLSSIMFCDDDAQESTIYIGSPREEMTPEYLEGDASQVEGSLLALFLDGDSLSSNGEADVDDVEQDVIESDKILVPRSEDVHMSRVDKTSDQELLKMEFESDSSADESGLKSDDDECSLVRSDDSAHKTGKDGDCDEKSDDDDEDALSLLAPSDASFLSEFEEEPQDKLKCKKAFVEMVADNPVSDLESGVVTAEVAADSTRGKGESKVSGRVISGSLKIAQSTAQHKEHDVDKPSVSKDLLPHQNVNHVETLHGLLEQKNVFGCIDVVKQIEKHWRMTGVQMEFPSDVLMDILDQCLHYSYTLGAFYILKKMYAKPQLLTAKICNRVLRMCHPFRRDCLPELAEMFDNLSMLNIMPDIDCFVSLIRAFIESENWEKVWQVLKYACESSMFTVPIRLQEMACQTCLNHPERYAMHGVEWLRVILREQFVEYLQDVNHNILVDMAEICINLNERDVAVELKAAVSPVSTISIGFEDEVEICPTSTDDLTMFASRIKGCRVTKNWRYLALTFIDVCASTSTSNAQLFQTYCEVFLDAESTQQIVCSFTEFLHDVLKEFERDRHDNPLLEMDYSTASRIGRTLMFHCYQAKKLNHSYTILAKLLEFKLPCRSRNVAIDQKFLIVAIEICIYMEECHRCLKILEGFNWHAQLIANIKELNRFLFLMMKLLDMFLRRSDCKSATKILSIILTQKQVGDTSMLSGPELANLENSLICKAVNIGDMTSAISMYNLHISALNMPALETKTLRLLVVSCAETGLLDEAHTVFSQCKKLSIYNTLNVTEMPRELLLSSLLTPTEVLFVIQDFLLELYGYLCSQTLAGHALTYDQLQLSLRILMYNTEMIDDPFLSVLPQCVPAAQNMVLSIIRQDLEPPLAASVTMTGLIEINWNSLEIYLQNLDQKGNRQGLHFTIPPYHGAPRLPADQDLTPPMLDQRNASSRGYRRGGLRPPLPTGVIRPPNPGRGSRRRGSSIPCHPPSWPPPLASLVFEDQPDFLQWRPPLLHGPLLPPDRFDIDGPGQRHPHMGGLPMPPAVGCGMALERAPIRSQWRPTRGRGRWSSKNTMNKIQKLPST